ncbi:hypothetical protein BG74_02910 [Sodalis-like endosymbiont of Proechinophthirus fluctus]|nr:hypothetical protein BG74_02910 [Sodalis-like endosymbiont of Proechinophthirus fluctus]
MRQTLTRLLFATLLWLTAADRVVLVFNSRELRAGTLILLWTDPLIDSPANKPTSDKSVHRLVASIQLVKALAKVPIITPAPMIGDIGDIVVQTTGA